MSPLSGRYWPRSEYQWGDDDNDIDFNDYQDNQLSTSMKVISCLLIAWILVTPVAIADHTITSMGARSCKVWNDDRKDKDWSALTDETWVAGFLSGYVTYGGEDIMKGVRPDAIFALVDHYCLSNPTASLYDAANQVAKGLELRGLHTH